jgi:hypothetical protein
VEEAAMSRTSFVRAAISAGALGLAVGLMLHVLAVSLRDHGPTGAGRSLRGNGAAVVLLLAAVVLVAGLVVWGRRGGWLGALLWSVALLAGLFVVAGRI